MTTMTKAQNTSCNAPYGINPGHCQYLLPSVSRFRRTILMMNVRQKADASARLSPRQKRGPSSAAYALIRGTAGNLAT
jgi:hypothetical protein